MQISPGNPCLLANCWVANFNSWPFVWFGVNLWGLQVSREAGLVKEGCRWFTENSIPPQITTSQKGRLYFCQFLLLPKNIFWWYLAPTLNGALPDDLNCKSNFFCDIFGSKRLIIACFSLCKYTISRANCWFTANKIGANWCFFGAFSALSAS